MIESSNMRLTPQLFIITIEDEEGYTAIGSRKIHSLEIAAVADYFDEFGFSEKFYVRGPQSYEINGILHRFTVVKGHSRSGTIGQLLDALDEEERLEEKENWEKQKRQQDRERFGGEVDEELVRKIVKWRKKQTEKEEAQRALDAKYDDDYYEDRYE